ncbi:MAG: hypothetical protein PWP34_516 [Desulfuromonadales bacterium]|jgi:hypothetical protein|nr:hypothetical protein [Desulfuromonadales bacterium]
MVGLEKSLSAPRHRSKTFLGSLPGFCSDQGNETVRECRAVARLWQSDVAFPGTDAETIGVAAFR